MDRSTCLYPDRLGCDEVKQWLERTPVRLQPPFAAGHNLVKTLDFADYHPNCTGPLRLHAGVDVGRCNGLPVLAPWRSIVRRSGWCRGGGGYLFLEIFDDSTPEPVYLRLFHLGERYVRRGQVVATGEVIARIRGNSGSRSTGTHLHIELLYGRRWPQPWKYAVNIRRLAETTAWQTAIEGY
jgi:murein DD-endopeptidase MepM/ murein hydrolase activator NlpD